MKTKIVRNHLRFIPFEKILKEKLKSGQFRKSFTEEMNRLKLAHEIRALREGKKMTQKQVAKKADMPQSVIARIESGAHGFSIATLHKIARVFDRKIELVK